MVAAKSNNGAVEVGGRAVADGPLHAGDAGGKSNEPPPGTEAEATSQETDGPEQELRCDHTVKLHIVSFYASISLASLIPVWPA